LSLKLNDLIRAPPNFSSERIVVDFHEKAASCQSLFWSGQHDD
jgi:hypothetical protein